MTKGLFPRIDIRDLHFHTLFGSAALHDIADELDVDAGLTFPVQNFGNTECTAITVTDLCTDLDEKIYSFDYQMMKTLQLMGVGPDSNGADWRKAASVPIYVGLLEDALAPVHSNQIGQAPALDPSRWPAALDGDAAKNKKPAFLRVDTGPYDVFENIRSAQTLGEMIGEKRAVGIATSWYDEWENHTGDDGIMDESPTRVVSSHAYKICGWAVQNSHGRLIRHGEPFLKVKSWNPRSWGDNGFGYLSRAAVNRQFNQLFDPNTWASLAIVYEKVDPGTIESLKNRKQELVDVLIQFLQNEVIKLQARLNSR